MKKVFFVPQGTSAGAAHAARHATPKASTGMSRVLLLAVALSTSAVAARAEIIEGSCGTTDAACHYVLNTTDSTLSITGNGAILSNRIASNYRLCAKNVVINDGITKIGNQAFANFTNMLSVTIPSSVDTISTSGAFERCGRLESVTIPEGVTTLGYGVFWICAKLTFVSIPSTVTSIGNDMFWGDTNLVSVYNYSLIPQMISNSAYTDNPAYSSYVGNMDLYVPALSVDAYRVADGWKNFRSISAIPEPTSSACTTMECLRDSVRAALAQVGTLISGLQMQVSQVSTEKQNLNIRVLILTREKDTLQTRVANLTADTAALHTQVSTLTAENSSLHAQVSTLTTENITLQTQVSTLTTEKNTLQTQLTACQNNSGTAVVMESLPQLLLRPNPVGDVLYITDDVDGLVEIYDINGTLVLTATTNVVIVSSLKSGIYIVKAGMKAAKVVKR